MLINIAGLFYVIGFLVRDELILRLLILAGTILYLTYYFIGPGGPLWNAIITSSILGFANILVLGKIVFERTTLALTEDEKTLFEYLGNLNPGQFRKIMKHAEWKNVKTSTTICNQGEKADHLFFLLRGEALLKKGNNQFTLKPNNFIGEVAFILNGEYSATAQVEASCCYIKWNTIKLRHLMKKDTNLANAVNAIFNTDIAAKLSKSYQ